MSISDIDEVRGEDAPESATAELIAELPAVVKESKSGYKTTEFWITVATSLLVLLNGIPLPEKYEGIVIAGLGAVYALSRGIAKQGIPSIEESPVAIAPAEEIVQRDV